jgi:hypothetical protein
MRSRYAPAVQLFEGGVLAVAVAASRMAVPRTGR